MGIKAPSLKTTGRGRRPARLARGAERVRRNPALVDSPLVDTSRLELNPASLLADMKDLLAQIKPMWPGVVKAHDKLASGEGDEDDQRNFSERVLALFAIAKFAEVLIDLYDHSAPPELSYDEALEFVMGSVNDILSDRIFIDAIRKSGPDDAPPMGDSGIEYGAWIAGALAPSEKAPGRVFETMLLLLNGATDLHFGLGYTWRTLIGQGFDDAAKRLVRDVAKVGFEQGVAGAVDAAWIRSNQSAIDSFLKLHGRLPFWFELGIDRLKEAFAEGAGRGYELSGTYVYVIEQPGGRSGNDPEFDTFAEAMTALARRNRWNANMLVTDGWYWGDDDNVSTMYIFPNTTARLDDREGARAPRIVRYLLT